MDPNNNFANPAPQPAAQNPLMPPPAPVPAPAAQTGATDPKTQILERLKGSVNVLVTVSNNPSVDQLSAAIGFTLVLNKLKKHGTAVFSGQIPSTIEFLQPEKTIEKNTDSLRDFIVALDKAKADKLRYKIEDKFVKIFITPYHTSLSEKDLEFGQGDLNVDVILALGVNHRDELDQAVTAHGRILHDATIVSITKQQADDIGTINWHVPNASSFSEVLVDLSESLKSPEIELFDQQIATAFLTGIVAETDRFSNDKTTPQTMSVSAILMKAGANQQLIANKLEEPEPIPEAVDMPRPLAQAAPAPAAPMPVQPPKPNDGSLEIPHEDLPAAPETPEPEAVEAADIEIDDEGRLKLKPEDAPKASKPSGDMLPPVMASSGAANTVNTDDQTLEDIEKSVNSPHLAQAGILPTTPAPNSDLSGAVPSVPTSDVPPVPAPAPALPDEVPHITEAEARMKVEEAEQNSPNEVLDALSKPIAALNSVPVDLNMGHDNPSTSPTPPASPDGSQTPGTPPPPPVAPPWTPPAAP